MNNIIISMTTWKNRIKYISRTIFQMLNQTLKPEKIYLTLSTDEFPRREKDLPADLILIANNIQNFEIIWVKENTKAFKKLIPVLYKYIDKDYWICTVDDDVFYKKEYLEKLLNYSLHNYGYVINPRIAGNWLHGAFACYHTSYFKNKNIFKISVKQMIDLIEDDRWYSLCYHENGIKDKPIIELKKYVKMLKYENPLSLIYSKMRKTKKIMEKILKE